MNRLAVVQNRITRALVSVLVLVSLGPPAWAQSKGLLWKIDGPQPSYVFGTIHLSDPRVTDLPNVFWDAFRQTSTFAMEVVMESAGVMEMGMAVLAGPQEKGWEDRLSRDDYQKLQQAMQKRGFPPAFIPMLKPWVHAMLLSVPPRQLDSMQKSPPLDFLLQQKAVSQGKTVIGLEEMSEQVSVFERMSLSDQIQMLSAMVRYQENLEGLTEQLIAAYRDRDLAQLGRLMEEGLRVSGADRSYRDRLLVDRNRRMFERMLPLVQRGNAFIAVGAGHLVGEDGLLRLIERRGFRVR
ncbi:MAG: TraB/GumN family protein, partial [Nitrospirae bacterium]|nr:TraB/GumN family protein [Nitrospirota bacterium]